FPLFVGASVRLEESIERADPRLIFAQPHISAVATEGVGLRHRQRDAGLARISENELAGLDLWPLTRQRLDAAALDRRLIDAVFVTQRIEVARLRAEVLDEQQVDPRHALVVLAGKLENVTPLLLGIAEHAHSDVDLGRAERGLPVFRIVGALVPELPGPRGHPDAKG